MLTIHWGGALQQFRRYRSLLLLAVLSIALTGCLPLPVYKSKQDFTQNITEVLNPATDFWAADFNHASEGRLLDIARAIHFVAFTDKISDPDLLRLLDYLEAYATNGPNGMNQEQADALSIALLVVAQMTDFLSTKQEAGYTIERYAIALRKFNASGRGYELFMAKYPLHLRDLTRVLNYFDRLPQPHSYERFSYAIWETLKTLGYTAYDAYFEQVLEDAYLNDKLFISVLQRVAKNKEVALQNGQQIWPLQNFYWVFGNIWWLGDQKWSAQIDQRMGKIARSHKDYSNQYLVRKAFLVDYFGNTRYSERTYQDCLSLFPDYCITETEVLPNASNCTNIPVKIRAQDMSSSQMSGSCELMAGEVDSFHSLLNTNPLVPVAEDFNDKLEVIVFDDWYEYADFGYPMFNIGTNNGGIYIEGNPAVPGNLPRFYAHESSWLRPAFSVWNLQHEFVHYLDGRYIKYGAFGYHSGNIEWWAEGLAEYLAWKNSVNTRAETLLQTTPEASWPTLNAIFNTTYSSGTDMVYRWSYWTHRFMFEQHPEAMVGLSQYLKTGAQADFISYQATLGQWAIQYQAEFTAWLQAVKAGLGGQSGQQGQQALAKLRNGVSLLSENGMADPHSVPVQQADGSFQPPHRLQYGPFQPPHRLEYGPFQPPLQ